MCSWILKSLLAVSLLSSLVVLSHSAVLSIDLGSEWLKIAVVNLKPGQSPISIAINELSKRKSPALVAFHSGLRLLGEEAAGITARYPEKVYPYLRELIGKPHKYVKEFMESLYLPLNGGEDSRGATSFIIDDGVTSYSVEELLAMVLGYAVNVAETHSKVALKDAVVTVPPYFGQAERRALVQAAELAGITVLSLIQEHSGAALQYGIDKDFSNETRLVIFYDMGSRSTYAALVCYSAYTNKEFGKSTSVNQFQVKDVRWDPDLGGESMESRLVEYFADEFNKQYGQGKDVRTSPKAMAKLKKQVKRTKEILSANTVAPLSVESLYDDQDFRSTITREKFEDLCEDLWKRSLVPIKDVLKNSNLNVGDVYAVELIGGATRVPKLQATIQELFGRDYLDKHLDADESIVLGSALHAANLSDGIKLNRKLGIIDGSSYGFTMKLNGPDMSDEENEWQTLVPRMKRFPSKMFRSVVREKDFNISLAYSDDYLLPPGASTPIFCQYALSGLADAALKYSDKNVSSPIKANMHFSLSRSGILSLDRADAVIEVSEWVEVPRKSPTMEIANVTLNSSSEIATNHTSERLDKALNSSVDENGSFNLSPKEANVTQPDMEKRLKKRTFRVPLKVAEIMGPGMPLSAESLVGARRKLDDLKIKDMERRKTAEMKNSLEEYIYTTKDKLGSAEFEEISTAEEQSHFLGKLDEVQEWLYMDGEDANATEFEKQLDSLKAIGDPIFFRYKELSALPEAVEITQKYLNELKQIVDDWKIRKPWISKEKTEQILDDADKLKSWLDEKQSEHERASRFTAPVLTSGDVYQRLFELQDQVENINKISKPKPKIEKPVKNETEKLKENTTASKLDSESSKSTDATPLTEEAKPNNTNHDEL